MDRIKFKMFDNSIRNPSAWSIAAGRIETLRNDTLRIDTPLLNVLDRSKALSVVVSDLKACDLSSPDFPMKEASKTMVHLMEAVVNLVKSSKEDKEGISTHLAGLCCNSCDLIASVSGCQKLVFSGTHFKTILSSLQMLSPGLSDSKTVSAKDLPLESQQAALHTLGKLLLSNPSQLSTEEITNILDCCLQWVGILPLGNKKDVSGVSGKGTNDRDSITETVLEAFQTISLLLSSSAIGLNSEHIARVFSAVPITLKQLGPKVSQGKASSRLYSLVQQCAQQILSAEEKEVDEEEKGEKIDMDVKEGREEKKHEGGELTEKVQESSEKPEVKTEKFEDPILDLNNQKIHTLLAVCEKLEGRSEDKDSKSEKLECGNEQEESKNGVEDQSEKVNVVEASDAETMDKEVQTELVGTPVVVESVKQTLLSHVISKQNESKESNEGKVVNEEKDLSEAKKVNEAIEQFNNGILNQGETERSQEEIDVCGDKVEDDHKLSVKHAVSTKESMDVDFVSDGLEKEVLEGHHSLLPDALLNGTYEENTAVEMETEHNFPISQEEKEELAPTFGNDTEEVENGMESSHEGPSGTTKLGEPESLLKSSDVFENDVQSVEKLKGSKVEEGVTKSHHLISSSPKSSEPTACPENEPVPSPGAFQEASVLRDECVFEETLHKIDTADTRPWLLSKHCSRFFLHEFGVSVKFSESHAGVAVEKDSLHFIISKRIEAGWNASETKWFVNTAYDFLQSIVSRGLCNMRLAYEGPLSLSLNEPGPPVKEVARRVSGEDRSNFVQIEEETGVVLKVAQARSGSSTDEKKQKEGNGSGAPPSPPVRIVVRLRAARLTSLLAAEKLVSRLLDDTARYFRRNSWRWPARVVEDSLKEEQSSLAQKRSGSVSATLAIGSGDIQPPKRVRRSRSPVPKTESNAIIKGTDRTGTPLKSESQEIQEPADSPAFEIPSTRMLHVTCKESDEVNLSEVFVRTLFDSVLNERLEVPEGLLENNSMILKVTQLDRFLSVVELGHEQLAGACIELLGMEPDAFQGLSVKLGPAGDSLPTDPRVTILAITKVPEGSSVDGIYKTFHEALQVHATSAEKSHARKITIGRLVSTVRYNEKLGTALVYLPTSELADRTLAIHERDPQAFYGMWPKLHKEQPQVSVSSVDETGKPSKRGLFGSSGKDNEDLPPGGKKEGRKPVGPRRRLIADKTVFVQKVPQDFTEGAITSIFKAALKANATTADLETAEGGEIVSEVRRLRPFSALVGLGSQRLTMRILETYRKNPFAFKGMEVKAYRGSMFDTERKESSKGWREGRAVAEERGDPRFFSSGRGSKHVDGGHQDIPFPSGNSRLHERLKFEGDHELNWRRVNESSRKLPREDRSSWARPRAGDLGKGMDEETGKEFFVKLDREKCIYVSNVPQPMDELRLRNVFNAIMQEVTGQPHSPFVCRVKSLKGWSAFVEFGNLRMVDLLLRVYEREEVPRKRFQGMIVRKGSVAGVV